MLVVPAIITTNDVKNIVDMIRGTGCEIWFEEDILYDRNDSLLSSMHHLRPRLVDWALKEVDYCI